jgi:hypothetical protein
VVSDSEALIAPVDPRVSEQARAEAAALVGSLRDAAPGLLTIDGVDLGSALEQALFGRLRRLALGTRPRPAARFVHVRSLLRVMAATLPQRASGPAAGDVVIVLLSPAQEQILAAMSDHLARRRLPAIFTIYTAHLRGRGAGRHSARLTQMLPRRRLPALERYTASIALRLRRATAPWQDVVSAERAPFLRDKAAELLPRLAIEALALNAVAERGPALMGTFNEVARWSRLLPSAARRHGIPSLDIAHAEMADEIAIRGVDFDRYAVFGEQAAGVLRRAGVAAARIAPVGAPRFDQLIARHAGPPHMPTTRRIVFASQWLNGAMSRQVKRATLQIALDASSAAAPVEVIIRPHPIERDTIIDEVLAEFKAAGVAARVERSGRLYDTLDGAWLLMTGWSNAVFEGLLSNVPALCINATGGSWPVPFVESGVALGAIDPESARRAVAGLTGEEEWLAALARGRAAAERHLGPLDGRAAERVADLIGEMIAGSAPSTPG